MNAHKYVSVEPYLRVFISRLGINATEMCLSTVENVVHRNIFIYINDLTISRTLILF